MRKGLLRALAALPLAALGAAGYLALRLRASLPGNSGSLKLGCLEEEVEVLFDRAGAPHVYASRPLDAYRTLGYLMAQDRMVQMFTMLRVAQGRLAELVGSMGAEVDRFLRTVGLARAGGEFAANLDDESRACLDAFCEGINEYLARPGRKLPFELMFLGGRPEPWRAEDCLSLGLFMTWLLDSFWLADLVRERLIRSLGHDRAMEILPETAPYNNPPVKRGGRPARFETLDPLEEIDWDFESGPAGAPWLRTVEPAVFGSNNWALSAKRTTTGKPILAADPHIQHNAPGMLYMFHLVTPDLDITGAGFPGLPVVVYGHNGYCGWAATSLCPDTQDLYVETFESNESDRCLYDGEWEQPRVIEERVKVRFGRTRSIRVVVTRHGPVIKRKGNRGLSLRWVSHDVTLDSLSAFLRQNAAGSWEEFSGAMENFVGPAMNQVYADVDGNIGYLAATKIPQRKRGDGTIPYDGSDPENEWDGYVPFDRMPRCLNPREGFIVTANSKVVSEAYPVLITRAWEAPYRNGRIGELLRSRPRWAPEEMGLVHGDAFTFPGRRFAEAAVAAARTPAGESLSPAAREAVEELSSWDHQARADSPAMTIYFYSWERLREMLLRHRLGSTLFAEYTTGWSTVNLALENLLESRDPYWLPSGCDSYEHLVLDALEEGVAAVAGVFGTEDRSAWKWGRVHYLTCRSLLGLFWPLDRIFNVGPVPRDGEGDTVNASPPASDCLAQLVSRGAMGGCADMAVLPDCRSHAACAGPVLRMVLDFSNLDNSRMVLDVGQSGHRLSPHYKDHFPIWCRVEYMPLPYTRGAVEAQTAGTLRLLPR
ncbi:MAG: penicillin acylase family protein [Actinobacteria bacterium]|nr:penicillin acylase family protein [Actinomycetota bacterium]MBU1944829.1 penicillin acylase family protein [Actinomycetota bacterium]MBU2687104.1 penicillin acylase family protein [Actinomycetota bacterium]